MRCHAAPLMHLFVSFLHFSLPPIQFTSLIGALGDTVKDMPLTGLKNVFNRKGAFVADAVASSIYEIQQRGHIITPADSALKKQGKLNAFGAKALLLQFLIMSRLHGNSFATLSANTIRSSLLVVFHQVLCHPDAPLTTAVFDWVKQLGNQQFNKYLAQSAGEADVNFHARRACVFGAIYDSGFLSKTSHTDAFASLFCLVCRILGQSIQVQRPDAAPSPLPVLQSMQSTDSPADWLSQTAPRLFSVNYSVKFVTSHSAHMATVVLMAAVLRFARFADDALVTDIAGKDVGQFGEIHVMHAVACVYLHCATNDLSDNTLPALNGKTLDKLLELPDLNGECKRTYNKLSECVKDA